MNQRPFSTMAKNFPRFTSIIRESLSVLAAGRREAVVPATYRYIHVHVGYLYLYLYLTLHNHHLPRLKIVTTRASMQEDSRAALLQALTPIFYFCPIMRHCVVHKYNVLYLVPTDWPTCWMDSSGPTFPFNLTAKRWAAPFYNGDLSEFFFFLLFIGGDQNGRS